MAPIFTRNYRYTAIHFFRQIQSQTFLPTRGNSDVRQCNQLADVFAKSQKINMFVDALRVGIALHRFQQSAAACE